MGTHSYRAAVVVALLALAGCGVVPPDGEPRRPRHVLLISIDAMRADVLGADGARWPTTPFLDRLAAGGVRYPAAFVATHGTPPSHTSLLSSLSQQVHGVGLPLPDGGERLRIPAAVRMIQEEVRDAGWTTVGVTGGGYVSRALGFARGFDRFDDGARSVEEGTARLLEEIREAMSSGRPVFAFYHTYQVHSPYTPPPEYLGRFGPADAGVDATSEALAAIQTTAREVLSLRQLEQLEARYAEEMRYTDDVLARSFAELEELGFLADALVIVTSDHGEEFGDHGWLMHGGRLFEELIRVPLIVAGPGAPAGVVDPALASHLDVAPTVLAALGLPVPPAMEGRDLLAAAAFDEVAERHVVAQYSDRLYAVRTSRFKLIERRPSGAVQLFDLRLDPAERRPVHRDHPALVAELRAELEEWRAARTPLPTDASDPIAELDAEAKAQLKALGYLSE